MENKTMQELKNDIIRMIEDMEKLGKLKVIYSFIKNMH